MAIRTFADGSSLDTSTGVVTHASSAPVEVKQPPTTQVSGGTSSVEEMSTAPVFNREQIKTDISNTLGVAGVMDKQANKAFFDAATRYSEGRNATDEEIASGLSVSQVMDKYNLGDLAPAHGINVAPPDDKATPEPEEQPRSSDPVGDAIDRLIALKQGNMQDSVDVNSYLAKKNAAATEVETARQAIADKKLIDAVKLEAMGDRVVPMTMINRERAGYTADQYITDLKMAQDYNNKLILSKMAEGNFLEAQRMNKEIANDNFEIAKLQIEKARNDQVINDREAGRLEKENDYQRTMAENGYIYISDPAQLSSLTEDQIYRDPVNGRIYKMPEAEVETQVVKGSGGRSLLINKQTGEVIKDLGSAYKYSGGGSSGGSSTIKLSAGDKKRLIAAGMTSSNVDAYWKQAQEEGIDSVIAQLDDTQAQVFLDVTRGVTTYQADKDENDISLDDAVDVFIEDEDFTASDIRAYIVNENGDPKKYEDKLKKKEEQERGVFEKIWDWGTGLFK